MLSLDAAKTIVAAAAAKARDLKLLPLAIVVLDARGALKAAEVADGTSLKRPDVAIGKAYGALSMGVGTRGLAKRAEQQPWFIAAVTHVSDGKLVPSAGGVLIKDAAGQVVGAIGVSGDTSDNDEIVALAGIAAAGLSGDTGG